MGAKHLPGVHNQLTHGRGGLAAAIGDALGLADKIDLPEGDRLIGSGRLATADHSYDDLLFASIESNGGNLLRLGMVRSDDAKRWRAANRGGTVELDADGVQRLHQALLDLDTSGKRWQADSEADWAELQRIERRRDQLSYEDQEGRLTPMLGDEMDSLNTRISVLRPRLEADSDETFASGVIPGGPWGDFAYQAYGAGTGEADDWIASIAVVPPGTTNVDWESEDLPFVYLEPKHLRSLANKLDPDSGKATGSTGMHVKQLGRLEIKDAERGEFRAVVATLGVIDSDGDVTRPGAFSADEFPVSAYGHKSWEGALPVGVASIKEIGNEAIAEGRFFLDTSHGQDTFTTVKNLGALGQWSYGYDAEEASFGQHEGKSVRFLEKLKVHEASPVLLGAGVGTRTLSTKGRNIKFSDEAQAVMAAVRALSDRAADVMAMRQEKGKALGADSKALVEQVAAELKRLSDLLAVPEEPDHGEVEREFLRFVAATR